MGCDTLRLFSVRPQLRERRRPAPAHWATPGGNPAAVDLTASIRQATRPCAGPGAELTQNHETKKEREGSPSRSAHGPRPLPDVLPSELAVPAVVHALGHELHLLRGIQIGVNLQLDLSRAVFSAAKFLQTTAIGDGREACVPRRSGHRAVTRHEGQECHHVKENQRNEPCSAPRDP